MKKILAMMMVAAMVHTASATTYVYDNTVSDWFGTGGWTHVVSDPGPVGNPLFSYSDPTSIHAANNYGVLDFSSGYVGAEWTAPIGEVITQVEFSFWGVIGTNSAPSLTVYAGEDSADTFVGAYALPAAWTSSSQSVSFSESQAYNAVAIRTWDYQNQPCGFYAGWHSMVSAVTITTVPEPAALVLLGCGAMGWMRRRK
jgi:hypothetical protein